MTVRASGLALLVLVLAPTALAASPVASLESTRLEASRATASGSLAGLEHLGGAGRLQVSAARIEAVLEQESAHTRLNQTPQNGGYRDEGPQSAFYADVQDGQATLHPSSLVYVFPLPGTPAPQARPAAGCVAIERSQRTEVRQTNITMHALGPTDRHQERADTRRALAWNSTACSAAAWVVEGSFMLTLWEGDLSFRHAGGAASYATGAEYPPEAAPGISLEGNRTNRQLYLTVRDGRVQLGGSAAVYLGDALVQADSLVLRRVTGRIPAFGGGASLAGEDVELQGHLDARVAPSAQALAVRVTGTLHGGSVGGRSMVVATGGASLPPSAWMAALLLLPLVAGGVSAWRRRDPVRALARLERMARAGQDAKVAVASRRLQRVRGLSAEATGLRVEALARSGRLAEAIAEASRLPPMEARLAQAYAYALAADTPACVAALHDCAALDAPWTRVALRDPAFAAARRDASLRRAVGIAGGAA